MPNDNIHHPHCSHHDGRDCNCRVERHSHESFCAWHSGRSCNCNAGSMDLTNFSTEAGACPPKHNYQHAGWCPAVYNRFVDCTCYKTFIEPTPNIKVPVLTATEILARREAHARGENFSLRSPTEWLQMAEDNAQRASDKVALDAFVPVDFEEECRMQEGLVFGEPNAQQRKNKPIFEGCLAYFPDALLLVAECSRVGNDQHNPGEPLHWAKEKSTDEDDTCVRHLMDRKAGKVFDTDRVRHRAKAVWRALAGLQREIEAERKRFANGYS